MRMLMGKGGVVLVVDDLVLAFLLVLDVAGKFHSNPF